MSIHFGESSYRKYQLMFDILTKTKYGNRLEERIKNCKNAEIKQKLQCEVEGTLGKIKTLVQQYKDFKKKMKDRKCKEIKCAYVVFRSMEGAARARTLYSKNLC